jgi:glycosyltransferase involved in cell wall biosynthesis
MNTPLLEPVFVSAPCTLSRVLPETLTCILPAYNEATNLELLVPKLAEALAKLAHHPIILVVDDGSHDDTLEKVRQLTQHYPVRLLQLSRNFGKENAVTAGLDHADSDVVIIMDADGQHPVDLLKDFVRHWQAGADMVYGIRQDRTDQPGWRRLVSHLFYRLITHNANIGIEPNAGDFRLMDRCVVNAIRDLPESNRFMKGIYAWVGFKTVALPFQVQERQAGHSSFNLPRLLKLALDGLFSFSEAPLRIASAVGAVISIAAILYGIYIAFRTLVEGVDLPGWATLTVGITFLGGIQLLCIGILGEYVGRIFSEVKHRPHYIVRQRAGFDDKEQD